MNAICGDNTFSTRTSRFSNTRPLTSITCLTAKGRVRTPLFASVANATATSSGVTSAAPREIDEGFEDRSGLAFRLKYSIELRLLVTAPAHHRLDFTGLRPEHDHRAFQMVV